MAKAEPKDKKLYNYVKSLANKKFMSKSGVYRSSWIVKEYKKRGGLYKSKKSKSNTGLKRWYKEKWVDLNRPIKNSKGKIIGYKSCGRKSVKSNSKRYPLCRPTKRVSPQTPRTYKQISKKSLSKAKREKERVKGSKNIKFGGSNDKHKYEFIDTFIKSCKCSDKKCKCDSKRQSKKCINDKCQDVKIPQNKREIMENYYKQIGGKAYNCKLCSYTTSSKMDMIRHKLKHAGQKKYKCDQCEYTTFRKEKINLHKMNQHGGVKEELNKIIKKRVRKIPGVYYQCPICMKQFDRNDKRLRHLRNVHKNDKTVMEMVDLDRWYKESLSSNFTGKLSQVGSGKNKSAPWSRRKMKCPVCFKELSRESNVSRHLKETHKSDTTAQQILDLDKWYKQSIDDNFTGIKHIGSGKDRSQYYGKRSKIMVKIPENVKKTAKYAFKLKKLGFKGGIETGWKRARQLANRDSIPIQDLKYMRAWFARHLYTSYPTYRKWKKAGRPKDKSWHNKRGIIAWLIWSGDAAFKWVNSSKNINLLNKTYNKNYKALKLRV